MQRHKRRLRKLSRKRADLVTGRGDQETNREDPADRLPEDLDDPRFNRFRFRVRAQLRGAPAIGRRDLDRDVHRADRCLRMGGGPAIAIECGITIGGISAISIEAAGRFSLSVGLFRLAIADISAPCRRGCTDICRLRHQATLWDISMDM
jgi:hypothetical protein